MSNDMASITEKCKHEIIRLHVFFEQWFTGMIPNADDEFERGFSSVMHTNFHLISPRGIVDTLPDLINSLRRAYGVHSKIIIEIKNVECLFVSVGKSNTAILVRYEEWQKSGDDSDETARLSTVLFEESNDGLKWVHVHETWLPEMGPKGQNKNGSNCFNLLGLIKK